MSDDTSVGDAAARREAARTIPPAGVHEAIGATVDEVSRDRVVVSVPVGPKVHQPFGLLHGGVSGLIAESAASIGASLNVPEGHLVVGTELNVSHLRGIGDGVVRAVATPLRVGRTVQVWDVDVRDQEDRLIAKARLSLAVVPPRGDG